VTLRLPESPLHHRLPVESRALVADQLRHVSEIAQHPIGHPIVPREVKAEMEEQILGGQHTERHVADQLPSRSGPQLLHRHASLPLLGDRVVQLDDEEPVGRAERRGMVVERVIPGLGAPRYVGHVPLRQQDAAGRHLLVPAHEEIHVAHRPERGVTEERRAESGPLEDDDGNAGALERRADRRQLRDAPGGSESVPIVDRSQPGHESIRRPDGAGLRRRPQRGVDERAQAVPDCALDQT